MQTSEKHMNQICFHMERHEVVHTVVAHHSQWGFVAQRPRWHKLVLDGKLQILLFIHHDLFRVQTHKLAPLGGLWRTVTLIKIAWVFKNTFFKRAGRMNAKTQDKYFQRT